MKRQCVLVVDDCEVTLIILRAALEARGYRVVTVACGAAALDAAARDSFDAVVLDVELPDIDGMALGRLLRQDPRNAAVRIAMHTSVEENRVRAGFGAYDRFLPKSRDPLALGAQIESLMAGAAGPGPSARAAAAA